jgi:ribosomal protein L11 methyltransferase
MYWLEVSLTVDEETAEFVSDILRPFAQDDSVVLEQMGDANNLEPDALERDVTGKIYIPGDEDSEVLRGQIETALSVADSDVSLPKPRYQKLEEADWANAWKANYTPFRIGERLWIQPSWLEAEDSNADDIRITLDPGMAFGTGTHQTTQLCLMALEKYLTEGARVLDVGTGSGILAIAAVKLGAAEVVALDTDRQAVKAVIENGRINQVASKITTYQGTLAEFGPQKKHWDLTLVNILAPVILALLGEDDLLSYAAENGRVIFSGIIHEQVDEVERAIRAVGGMVIERMSMGDWVALVVEQ